jgi:hypothetical protein
MSQSDITVVTYNFEGMLEKLSGVSGWNEVEGPDSGSGLDYWYVAPGEEGLESRAYINVNQTEVLMSVQSEVLMSVMPCGYSMDEPIQDSFDIDDPEHEYREFVIIDPVEDTTQSLPKP